MGQIKPLNDDDGDYENDDDDVVVVSAVVVVDDDDDNDHDYDEQNGKSAIKSKVTGYMLKNRPTFYMA